jgi:predicted RNase H-like HicB family nuclease
MARSESSDARQEGVEFVHEDDGCITARDLETGVASYGETKAEALAMLAEALALHAGEGEPVDDEDLREFGLDPDEDGDEDLPDFMQ